MATDCPLAQRYTNAYLTSMPPGSWMLPLLQAGMELLPVIGWRAAAQSTAGMLTAQLHQVLLSLRLHAPPHGCTNTGGRLPGSSLCRLAAWLSLAASLPAACVAARCGKELVLFTLLKRDSRRSSLAFLFALFSAALPKSRTLAEEGPSDDRGE